MTKYRQNDFGIEALEIIDYFVPNIDSDEDPIYELYMTVGNGDTEIYCSSAYEKNLENIQVQLEKQFNLTRKESGYSHPKIKKSLLEKNYV